jgi:hypothetical protein
VLPVGKVVDSCLAFGIETGSLLTFSVVKVWSGLTRRILENNIPIIPISKIILYFLQHNREFQIWDFREF